MILLPPNPQRAWLRSFWAAIGILATIIVGMLGCIYKPELWWCAPALAILFAAGFVVPRLFVWPYRAWNKLARLYAGSAEALIVRIAFFVVCVPAGWASSDMRVSRPPSEGTLWLSSASPKPIEGPFPAKISKANRAESWVARYAAWAWQSEQKWRLALLPFLYLLFMVRSSVEEPTVPDSIYTLF
jgi:hypothetical protein